MQEKVLITYKKGNAPAKFGKHRLSSWRGIEYVANRNDTHAILDENDDDMLDLCNLGMTNNTFCTYMTYKLKSFDL